MGWTLLVSEATGSKTSPLPNNATAYIVLSLDSAYAEVVLEKDPRVVQTELGRIAVGPWGVKLEATDDTFNILPGQNGLAVSAAVDPRIQKYELKPRADGHSEAIFLRHGDIFTPSKSKSSLTCNWDLSEVLVDSSAVVTETAIPNKAWTVVAEASEEVTDDEEEDLNKTLPAISRSTPNLSHQTSIIVQETPTAARISGQTEYSPAPEIEKGHSEAVENTPPLAEEPNVESFSTARSGQSESGEADVTNIDAISDEVQAKSPATTKKRHSPMVSERELEEDIPVRASKRAKNAPSSDHDTQDSRLSSIDVDMSHKATPATKGKKRLSDVPEATPPRSQRSSQRSRTSPNSEPYDGPDPRVAFSNSALTETSTAVKFLKKNGGTFVDSIKGKHNYNILCVKDGALNKTMKLLQSLALGIPIVTDKWLLESARATHFLALSDYQPLVPEQEREGNFELGKVWCKPQSTFKGYTVYFTPSLRSTHPAFAELEQVCKSVGAKVTKKIGKGEQLIVLGTDEHDKEAEALMGEGVVCYNKDLLTNTILRGELDLNSDEFKIKTKAASAGTGKAAKSKRTRHSTS
ncbi:hypothetical protein P153DRAFT_368961 [Dothidotthia symphoricarpi CBS 119687]|uniref:BRCT domain-containing protein n=1 Tax=Dothidotthia symphoricarpi CBS 119687 TaxID=1392245 RepID=A0A6A6A8H4_9PLEO|nr:uncharacterized protein P153DRAFT_368961 [Dothidotthia symphoricarpi CBS 119687]KAF2126941.1 hypothetical protein P153DRAFT_368961 [Dothidotthia symphoricarpi CBS 119687]